LQSYPLTFANLNPLIFFVGCGVNGNLERPECECLFSVVFFVHNLVSLTLYAYSIPEKNGKVENSLCHKERKFFHFMLALGQNRGARFVPSVIVNNFYEKSA
jgi:hypothetical protein